MFSREKLIMYQMKNKTASNVTEAMKIIINKSKPENINGDQGS